MEEYEIRLDDGREFDFDVVMATSAAAAAGEAAGASGIRPVLPPKPARSDVYRLMTSAGSEPAGTRPEDANDSSVLNVASYAAAIASDTAHLTRLSVSPLEFDAGRPLDQTFAPQSSLSDGSTAVSGVSTGTLTDPTPKTIDYQNARRQKGKPPSPSSAGTDWSPISDLSPIIDVSPSIERIEQDRMSAGGISRGAPPSGVRVVPPQSGDVAANSRRVLPSAPHQTHPADVVPASSGIDAQYAVQRQVGRIDGTPEDVYRASDVPVSEAEVVMMRSSLKRCPNFDNISSISSVNDATVLQQQSNAHHQEAAKTVSPASSGSRSRAGEPVAVPAGQSKFVTEPQRSTAAADFAGDIQTEVEQRGRQDSETGSQPSPRPATDAHLRAQDSTRRQTASDATTISDREQRSPKTGAPAISDSAAVDKSAKEQRIAKPPSSEATVQRKQLADSTGKSATSRDDSMSAGEAKKTRRRLPPVPVDADTVTARPARRIRSRSADSRVDEESIEKERLRRHLKLREVDSCLRV